MTEKSFNIIGLGEILWDCLPAGRQLGGAPANFAYTSNQLGNNGIVLSRVGNDDFGKEVLEQLQIKNLSTNSIQIDLEKQTGVVNVTLENGQPSYNIVENVAWDNLELTENWREIAKIADAVCFGSLAQRNENSRKTIREFVGLTNGLRIFDVNLRQEYFSKEILRESLMLANICKLNHEELPIVAELFEIAGNNIIETAQNLRREFNLKLLCVTRGSNGSLLITENDLSEFAGLKITVADTIGAGDAFTSGMTHGLLRNWGLDKINKFANKVGAFVASNTGAMPDFSR
ncbi:MAG TPA: carbohydrate kinase, partial [Pyrinomonadaceae bacterium]|nr:carbohydrate kinase [Pyrinomonadaceae bacterium]